ncbi:MAG: PH domain-containing protein [Synergistaceae bacterium]|nr:PH domain-containing protein [Synergistaceae bacterium]
MDEQNFTEQRYRPAWRSFYWHIAAMVIFFLVAAYFSMNTNFSQGMIWGAFLILVLYAGGDMTYRRFRVMLIVKSDEIALEKGFIGRHSIEISTKNIKTIQVKQSIIERILNTGEILVASPGTDEYEIIVSNMPSPHAIRDTMQKRERVHDNPENTSEGQKDARAD